MPQTAVNSLVLQQPIISAFPRPEAAGADLEEPAQGEKQVHAALLHQEDAPAAHFDVAWSQKGGLAAAMLAMSSNHCAAPAISLL